MARVQMPLESVIHKTKTRGDPNLIQVEDLINRFLLLYLQNLSSILKDTGEYVLKYMLVDWPGIYES